MLVWWSISSLRNWSQCRLQGQRGSMWRLLLWQRVIVGWGAWSLLNSIKIDYVSDPLYCARKQCHSITHTVSTVNTVSLKMQWVQEKNYPSKIRNLFFNSLLYFPYLTFCHIITITFSQQCIENVLNSVLQKIFRMFVSTKKSIYFYCCACSRSVICCQGCR